MTSIRHSSAHANIQVPASQHTGPTFYTSDRRFSARYACTTPMRPNRPASSATSIHKRRWVALEPFFFFFGHNQHSKHLFFDLKTFLATKNRPPDRDEHLYNLRPVPDSRRSNGSVPCPHPVRGTMLAFDL